MEKLLDFIKAIESLFIKFNKYFLKFQQYVFIFCLSSYRYVLLRYICNKHLFEKEKLLDKY